MSEHMPIPGFPGYRVTDDGRVFSTASNWRGKREREMAQDTNSHGYPSVRLTTATGRARMVVHRLVAAAYLPFRPSALHEIRHLNGDRADSQASNLAWGTRADNAADREIHGRTSRGVAHSEAIKRGIAKSTNPFWRHAR